MSITASLAQYFLILSISGIRGVKESIKKCSLGKGTKFTACFLKLEFNCPWNLSPHVEFAMAVATKSLASLNVGFYIFIFLLHISKSASFCTTWTIWELSMRWGIERTALYGLTTVSLFSEGNTLKFCTIILGNSSLIFYIRRQVNPDPVPPLNPCNIWNPSRCSHPSA